MSPWRRVSGGAEAGPGTLIPASELAEAVAGLVVEDAERVQVVAFAVACAVRDADDGHALPVLTDLLAATSGATVNDGTLINLLSAVEYATALPAGTRAGWQPPTEAVARLVRHGLSSNEALRDQAEGVLWALVDDNLAAGWLGRDATRDLGGRVSSIELRDALRKQALASAG